MTQNPTHTVSTPNAKPPREIDLFRKELQTDYQKQVENFFQGDKTRALKFMSTVVYSVQKNPALLQCEKSSLFTAFMSCAEYELYPSNVSGEAYVIPYKGKAQFQLGYKGIITLLYRAGIQSISTQIVRKNDTFDYEEGLEPRLVHRFGAFATEAERGEPVGVYAIAVVNGEKLFKVMSKEDVLKFKALSQAKNSEYSPWNSSSDPELHMWRKTCIKQLAKNLPMNDSARIAVAKDDEGDSAIARPALDAAGPAVGRALHDPQPEKQPEAPHVEEEPVINLDDEDGADD
jgi:recombination protein RecT